MGMMNGLFGMLFGHQSNGLADTLHVFRESAENGAQRLSDEKTATLAQFAAEFAHARKGWFDRLIDGLNRLPRPALALGTIGLFISAMWAPEWFAARMTGVALIPEPLWWLMGAVVSFYFGARHQAKGQEFQRSVVETVAMTQAIAQDRETTTPITDAPDAQDNPALAEWWAKHGT